MPSTIGSIITSDGLNKWRMTHPSGETIKVGGTYIEMPRFVGESMLKPALQIAGNPVPTLQLDKIAVGDSKLQLIQEVPPINSLYNELGGIDQIITLYSPPNKNELVFDYDSVHLVGYPQPPLTQEWKVGQDLGDGRIVSSVTDTDVTDSKGNVVAHRPDFVVNSIAWCHDTKGGMVSTADVAQGITTGQGFMQYAMIAMDSAGQKAWAGWELLKAGQYRLVLDDKFMAQAVYPIVLSPAGDTFGYITRGASSYSWGSGWMYGWKTTYSPASDGTATLISICTSKTSGSSLTQGGIYTVSGTTATKVASSASSPDVTAKDFYNCVISVAVLAATNYTLFAMGNTGPQCYVYYLSSTASWTYQGSWNTWPSSMTVSTWATSAQLSYYVTYTAGGADYIPSRNYYPHILAH